MSDRPLRGTIGHLRQLRYRGIRSNDQWLHLRMAALNLRRLINLGLDAAADGSWIIPGPA